MYGMFFKSNVDIGNTNTYSLAAYRTKIKDNDYFTDGIIGLSLLEIDHRRVINGNKLEG